MYEQGNQAAPQERRFAMMPKITKLMLFETGTYNPMYRRPYTTKLTGTLLEAFDERLSQADKITPTQFGGLAGAFLAPQAAPEMALTIQNGFGERRLSFMMEVQNDAYTGGRTIELVLGYTSHMGISQAHNIDPQMEFIVNSVQQVRVFDAPTSVGNQTHYNLMDRSQVVVDRNFAGPYTTAEPDNLIRPQDVFSTMALKSVVSDQSQTYDFRTKPAKGAVKTRRSNNLPSNYIAGVLQGYKSANSAAELGMSGHGHEMYGQAQGYVTENMMTSDPFMQTIAKMQGVPSTIQFNYSMLQQIDPNVDNVVATVLLMPTERHTVHQVGESADWGVANELTTVATQLSNEVPNLLAELGMTRIIVKTSNYGIGGAMLTSTFHAKSFSSMDLSRPLDLFRHRLEHEIMSSITQNNHIPVGVEMHIDLLGETRLWLEYDGRPRQYFVTPSFCDALAAPVLTSSKDLMLNIADDFEAMTRELFNTGSTSLGVGPGSFNF